MRQTGLLVILAQMGCMVPTPLISLYIWFCSCCHSTNSIDPCRSTLGGHFSLIFFSATSFISLYSCCCFCCHSTNSVDPCRSILGGDFSFICLCSSCCCCCICTNPCDPCRSTFHVGSTYAIFGFKLFVSATPFISLYSCCCFCCHSTNSCDPCRSTLGGDLSFLCLCSCC